jgi:hypothetical protein
LRAAAFVASSTRPSGPGGVITTIFGTPATSAGIVVIMVTLGKAPLPRGT